MLFNFVLIFNRLFRKIIRVRLRNGLIGNRRGIGCFAGFVSACVFFRLQSVIANDRNAVHTQVIDGHTCAYGCVGLGTAQRQTAYDIGHRGIVVGRQLQYAFPVDRGLIIHQHQTVAVAVEHVYATGYAHHVIRFAGAQDDAILIHMVGGTQSNRTGNRNVFIVLILFRPGVPSRILRHGYIFSGQDQAVPGKILQGKAGAHAAAVAFRKGKVFAPVSGTADHIGIRLGVHRNVFAGPEICLFAEGHNTLVMQGRNIKGPCYRHVFPLFVVRIHGIAAGIIIGVRRRTENIGNIRNQFLHLGVNGPRMFDLIVEERKKFITDIQKIGPVRFRNRIIGLYPSL